MIDPTTDRHREAREALDWPGTRGASLTPCLPHTRSPASSKDPQVSPPQPTAWAVLQRMVERPLTSAYFEDYNAGRLDSEQVARALAGDYRSLASALTRETTE